MNAIDACYQLCRDFEKMLTNKLKNIRYDKTFRAKILECISDGKYKVLYKNKEYLAKSDYSLDIGDLVWVCAPENNWNELYVQGFKEIKKIQNQINIVNSNLNNKTVTSSGLTVTWGSITGGGYVVLGNTIILNVRITANTTLNANSPYSVSGFPTPVSDGMNGIVATTNVMSSTKEAYVDSVGVLVFTPNASLTSGSVIKLHACYIRA